MTGINSNYGYMYRQRSQEEAEIGYLLATLASAAVLKALPSFSNPFEKQMKKEWANNALYKDAFIKSISNSGLDKVGVKLMHVPSGITDPKLLDVARGLNAFYTPDAKQVFLNADKATIAGFHELGHAMNHLKSKTGKFLQSFRRPGYAIAGLMGTVALFSRSKPKDAKRNVFDFVQDNCGKIAFAAMLPTVIEESMASYKGIKLAKQAGLSDALVKNLRKFYGKALLSYGGYALLIGFSTFIASKITEIFTRPKKIEY
ncbi:hypothetical protein IJD34_09830 [bacterium]|nr:hypothetical protein [bacterium]